MHSQEINQKLVTVTSFLLIAILISTAIKLYHAYVCSFYIFSDTAIMGSIAKQILNGEFPLFFYGGFYTWAIESWIIAPFFFLFGISNYTVHLGPIFVSILFLISIYLLGKEFKNSQVALFALIYSAFPPFYFFKYSVIPVGYLAELTLFGNIVLLLTLKIIRAKSFQKNLIYFSLLGLASALAFWAHYIALYYLTAVAMFLFINMIKSRKFMYYLSGGITGLFSFFIGGLPCWIFSLRHDFVCFKFSNTGVTLDILNGLKRFITYQVPGILGNNLFTIAIFIIAIFFLVVNLKTKRDNLLILFFFISMAILFTQGGEFSKGADFRYIIPMFSLVPLVIAYFLNWVNNKVRFMGTVILGILVLINVYNIRDGILTDKYEYKEEGRVYDELMNFFTKHKIEGVYGELREVSTISFLGKDKIFAVRAIDSANPFDGNVIGSMRVAYIDWDNERPIFDMLCRSYKRDIVNRYSLLYDFEPWGYYGQEILPEGWRAISNYNPEEARCAFDRNLVRYWSSIVPKKTGIYYQIEFPQAYTIYKFQMFNMPINYKNLPVKYRFSVSLDGKEWKLIKDGIVGIMFWSGPNPIYRQKDTRWEVIFHPVEARFVRIENIGEDNVPWEINEIIFHKYLGAKTHKLKDYLYGAKSVCRFLKHKDIRFVYTDYWLSEKIRTWSKGTIDSLRIYNYVWPDRPNTSRLMRLDKHTAIVVSDENEKAVENILKELCLHFRKKHIEDYVCFYFLQEDSYFLENLKSLYWTGVGLAKIHIRELGEHLIGRSQNPLRYYSGNTGVYFKLAGFYKRSGMQRQYIRIKEIIRHKFKPGFSCHVNFPKGIEFLGWSKTQKKLLRGDTFKIDYFWKINKEFEDRIFVFVHFIKDGKILFQNDHPILENYRRPYVNLVGGVWKESYIVSIPMEVPGGEYSIRLGLWIPEREGKRLNILGTRSTSVEIGKITVIE